MPPRTVMCKQMHVLRDVEAATTKTTYLPGLMLLEAAALGREEIVNALLDAGVSIMEADQDANTALMHAAFNCTTASHREVCRRLIEKESDPELANQHGMTAMDVALTRRDPKLRRTFKPSESDKDFTPASRTQFEIHKAIDTGDEETAMWELGKAGNLECAKCHAVTPLMMAARVGNKRIAQNLLDRGAKPDKKSEHWCTALNIAAEEGHVDVMEAILTCGYPSEDLMAADIFGTGPLGRASENGHVDAVRKLLPLCTKKEINKTSQKGWTPLMLATYNGYPKVVTLLLGNGAKPDIGKNMGKKLIYTPLCYACITGRLDCVRALIKADCPLEAQRAEVALKLAQDNGHDDIFRELKAAGALQSKEDEDKEKEEKDKEKDKAGGKGRRDTKEEEAKGGAEKGKAQKKADASGVAAAPSAAPAEENNIDFDAAVGTIEEREAELGVLVIELNEAIETLKAQLAARASKEEGDKKKTQGVRRQSRDAMLDGRAPAEEKAGVTTADERWAKKMAARRLWAFSPSGKWTPGMLASNQERGGIVTREYGEPAQSVPFIEPEPEEEVTVKKKPLFKSRVDAELEGQGA